MDIRKELLGMDPAAETDRIVGWLRASLRGFRRTGAVLGISGGIEMLLANAVMALFNRHRCASASAPSS